MNRSFAGVCTWMTIALAGVAGCGGDDPRGDQGRFTPGDNPIEKRQATEECEAGVCSPEPASSADAGATSGSRAACGKTSSCLGATDLGVVRGDEGGDTRNRQGVGSQFFSIDVTEVRPWYGSSVPMRVAVTLISPKSTNYDLFVYDDCAKAPLSSEKPAGDTDKISKTWGESQWFANGKDDRQLLRIEVRKVSQSCDPDDEWILLVQGNTE